MAWRGWFLTADRARTAAPSLRNDWRRIAGAPDALVDFHTVYHGHVVVRDCHETNQVGLVAAHVQLFRLDQE